MGFFNKIFQKSQDTAEKKASTPDYTAEEMLEQAKAYKAHEPEQAFKYFLKAAEMGNSEAMANVGYSYLYKGQGAPFDIQKSVYWYNKAASKGYAKSMIMTAWFYMAGIGAPQDDSKAIEWLKRAAQNGDEKTVAIANKELNDFEQTKFTVTSLLTVAVEMEGIPPKN